MKLNKKHFEYFKQRCEYWQKFFGLFSWSIYYEFIKLKGSRGHYCASYENMSATITLSTDFDDVDNIEYYIDRTAFHEIIEVMLAPLKGWASSRTWDSETYERENHAVIRTLENVMFDDKRKGK